MKRSRTLALSASAAVLAFGVMVWAAPAAGPQKDRHDAMEQVGESMKTLGKMAKGQAPFDATVVNTQATTIRERLEQAAKLFPPGSDKGETHAKPEVWADRAGFEKAMQDGIAAATKLQAVKDEAAFRPALGALGQNCKACHDKYRMPDEH